MKQEVIFAMLNPEFLQQINSPIPINTKGVTIKSSKNSRRTFFLYIYTWTLAIGESCLHEILAFSLDSFLNGRLENATI
jgi:hypothetical protein